MNLSNFQKYLSSYFPTPDYLELPSVGIDISPYAIRFMEIVSKKNHFEVGRYGHERLNTSFSLDQDESIKEVQTALRKWKDIHRLQYVEVSLPEEKAYLYKSDVALGSDDEMRSSIEFTLEENVPISPDEAIFDYRMIKDNGNGTAAVAVTVLPIDIIHSYINMFEEVGLTPISFLIEAQALAKAIIPKDDKSTYFIINIGELKTGLFVVSEGSVQFTSTLALGGRNFTEALIKEFNISREEAEDIKKNKGLSSNEKEKDILSALINTASAFREEIEKIYVYWHTHQERKAEDGSVAPAKKIILSGKDALMMGFKEYISQSIKVETEIANVWTNVASFDEYIPPISAHEAIDYGRSIGLALPKIT